MILAVTGHRPERLGSVPDFVNYFGQFLVNNPVTKIYVGMCEGADFEAAKVADLMGVPYVAVRPWLGHRSGSIHEYDEILNQAQSVKVLDQSMDYPGAHAYHNRNMFMVDNSDTVFAAWDGIARGGTYQTKNYAKNNGKRVYHYNVVTPSASRWL